MCLAKNGCVASKDYQLQAYPFQLLLENNLLFIHRKNIRWELKVLYLYYCIKHDSINNTVQVHPLCKLYTPCCFHLSTISWRSAVTVRHATCPELQTQPSDLGCQRKYAQMPGKGKVQLSSYTALSLGLLTDFTVYFLSDFTLHALTDFTL